MIMLSIKPLARSPFLGLFSCLVAVLAPVGSSYAGTAQTGLRYATRECGERNTEFHRTAMANGSAHDGTTTIGLTGYIGDDGARLGTQYAEFKSPQAAVAELRWRANNAKKIIKQGPKLDDKGRTVGERVEILTDPDDSADPGFEVLWTEGSDFHEISSSCKEKALELEKHYKDR